MIHFKGIGEHSVYELEKIILELQEALHLKQIEIQKAKDFVSIQERLPKNYNSQILVKKENENFCDLRFFHHEYQFKLLCSIHKYTHWRPIF